MRYFPLLVLTLFVTACAHQEQGGKEASIENKSLIVLEQNYGLATPAATGVSGQPKLTSSACAENFDGIVSHLEMLMANKAAAQTTAVSNLQ